MVSFTINDMTCGHCAASITQAVKALDPAATLKIDLPGHRVEIDSAVADAAALRDAIKDAGYTPVP